MTRHACVCKIVRDMHTASKPLCVHKLLGVSRQGQREEEGRPVVLQVLLLLQFLNDALRGLRRPTLSNQGCVLSQLAESGTSFFFCLCYAPCLPVRVKISKSKDECRA